MWGFGGSSTSHPASATPAQGARARAQEVAGVGQVAQVTQVTQVGQVTQVDQVTQVNQVAQVAQVTFALAAGVDEQAQVAR